MTGALSEFLETGRNPCRRKTEIAVLQRRGYVSLRLIEEQREILAARMNANDSDRAGHRDAVEHAIGEPVVAHVLPDVI